MANPFSSIPEIDDDISSHTSALKSIKQTLEQLIGVRGNLSYRQSIVYHQKTSSDPLPVALDEGDVWWQPPINKGDAWKQSVYKNGKWQLVVDTTPGPAIHGLPAAGAIGTVLTKASATDYDAAWTAPTVGLLQFQSFQTTATASGSTALGLTGAPTQAKGDQYMSLSFTPKSATSRIMVLVMFNYLLSSSDDETVLLWKDSDTAPLGGSINWASAANIGQHITVAAEFASPGTSAITLKVRAGPNTTGTTTMNGQASASTFTGGTSSGIYVWEFA